MNEQQLRARYAEDAKMVALIVKMKPDRLLHWAVTLAWAVSGCGLSSAPKRDGHCLVVRLPNEVGAQR